MKTPDALTDISFEINVISTTESCILPCMPQKKENLSDYVRRVMRDKSLSLKEVEKRSGARISAGYVNDILQKTATNPSVDKLQGLAKGLGVAEDEVFAIARGLQLEETTQFRDSEIAAIYHDFNALPEAARKELRTMMTLLHQEIERRLKL